MGDVDELIGRLRAWKAQYRGDGDESTIPLAAEAADALTALQAELAQCAKGHAEIASWYEDAAKGWSAAQVQVAALQAHLAAVEAERDAALSRIEDVRAANAGNFDSEGEYWRGYDQACLDCHAALKGTDHG